jgi:hypothetical protein
MSLGQKADISKSETDSKSEKSGTKEGSFNRSKRERLEISDEAVDKIIGDVLGGADGLASIFAGEQNAGVFDSSVAAQAAGDLAANLVGEIAKLKAEKVTEEEGTELESFLELFKGETTTRSKGTEISAAKEFGL